MKKIREENIKKAKNKTTEMEEEKEEDHYDKISPELLRKCLKMIEDGATIAGVDPGDRKLFTMAEQISSGDDMGKDNVRIVQYSNGKFRSETGMIRTRNKINRRKDREENRETHEEWQKYSVKTGSLEKYCKNLRGMLPLVEDMFRIYNVEFYNKARFTAYIRRQETFNTICKELDSSPKIIGWGDGCGSRKGIKGNKSPCKELRKKIERNCKNVVLVNINEFKTTKMCSCCDKETGNVYVLKKYEKDGEEVTKRGTVYGLRRCKEPTCRITWDRDVNGSRNILKILKHILMRLKRPEHLRRNPKPRRTASDILGNSS
jgi:transposase